MPRNHISWVCAWLLAGNRISVFVRMDESKPDPPHRIRVDANRVCGLFQRIRNRVDVTSNRQSHLYGYQCERGLMTVTEDSTQSLHQKKLQQRLQKLISTTLLTSIKSIAEKRGNKAETTIAIRFLFRPPNGRNGEMARFCFKFLLKFIYNQG